MPILLNDYMASSWTHKNGLKGKIKLAILAAGLGKRMDPLTAHHLPKPMFPLGGSIPMSEIWVRRAVESGITDISMNLCVLSNTIKNHFKNGAKFGADINFVDEDTPSGTFGGICKQVLGNKAKQVLKNESMPLLGEFSGTSIFAPSGDIVTNFSPELMERMYAIHKQKGAALTMVLCPVPWDSRGEFGTVELGSPEDLNGQISKSGKIVNFREKDPDSPSNLNNASIYLIEKDLIKFLDPLRTAAKVDVDNPFYDFGKHVFRAMLGQLEYVNLPKDFILWGVQYDGLWFDVGRKKDYISVNKSVLDGDIKLKLPYETLPWGHIGTNVTIDYSKVTIIPPVSIGNNCVIEPGVTLGPHAIIGDDWTIEKGAHISNSVLWKRYSHFTEKGEISANDRKLVDRHQVHQGTSIEECIIVGGTIKKDLREKTVDVLEDGQIEILPNTWVPKGPRA